ncbi:hypothetical protein HELRODRAFT_184365 [Helobdella robusta]|uniref:SUEL-type lectin domain-containing protein n=1 Tax=Helobdella robusta TaxID=6412 RepID=T1FL22_HELRO|nr:hypothetical protein HELRODRAFT_184365 [Helobdella robusta]ESO00136.1 hypothetical protein HELRODRAFT_184365 [Helobdella robusta]
MARDSMTSLKFSTSIGRSPSEYCLTDTFVADCKLGSVILMTRALYGRMSAGKCVTTGYGYLGCHADVIALFDRECSGSRSCRVKVSDPAIVRSKPCPLDFTSYLEAEYKCIEGMYPFTD